MAKNTMQKSDFHRLRSQLDRAETPQDLLDIASAFGVGLTATQLDSARKLADEETKSAEARFTDDDEQAKLGAELRGIQNGGIKVSSKFVSYVLYYGAISAVVVLFGGEVWRLTPVIAPILHTHPLVAVIPTAMILIGYYGVALIGKAERKAYQNVIVTKRMENAAQKYLTADKLTPEEEKEGRIAVETMRNAKRAGRGYGMVEWTLFVGLHLLAAYHAIADYRADDPMPVVFSVAASVGLIFLLLIVTKMLVTHIYVTSNKPIVTGIQGFNRDEQFELSYGRAVYRALIAKASANVEEDETVNPTGARVTPMPAPKISG